MGFIYNTFLLSRREYAKIYGEINTWYFFENDGYNNYNIYMRIKIIEED